MTTEQLLIIILSLGVPMFTGFGWLIHLSREHTKDLSNIKERIARLEEKTTQLQWTTTRLESMMQTIVGFLLGHKTGA
jgi:hypothetical protein